MGTSSAYPITVSPCVSVRVRCFFLYVWHSPIFAAFQSASKLQPRRSRDTSKSFSITVSPCVRAGCCFFFMFGTHTHFAAFGATVSTKTCPHGTRPKSLSLSVSPCVSVGLLLVVFSALCAAVSKKNGTFITRLLFLSQDWSLQTRSPEVLMSGQACMLFRGASSFNQSWCSEFGTQHCTTRMKRLGSFGGVVFCCMKGEFKTALSARNVHRDSQHSDTR